MPQRLEFPAFALEKAYRQLRLAADAAWREHICIGKLIGTIPKIARFDPTFINQRLDAVVRLTNADPQLVGELPLTEVRVCLKRFQHTVMCLGCMSRLVH